MNLAPIVTAVVLLGATVAGLFGFDVLPGEQTGLATGALGVLAGGASIAVIVKAILARKNAPPAPPAE